MSITDRLFNSTNIDLPFNWKNLNRLDQIEEMIERSKQKPVVIFKHSTRCGVSHLAQHNLERDWNFQPEDLDFYYLDLIRYRPVSNEVAKTFGVTHQSPQIIVLKDGEVSYHTSHHMISGDVLRKAVS